MKEKIGNYVVGINPHTNKFEALDLRKRKPMKEKFEEECERFDEYFYDSEHSLTKNQVEHIKNALFLPTIQESRQRLLQEIKDNLPKEKEIGECDFEHFDEGYYIAERGFNECLKEILTIITNLEK